MSLLSAILINGKRFFGSKLEIEVRIDGKVIKLEKLPNIEIVVQGNLEVMDVGAANSIEVQGSVGRIKSGSADVKCGDVHGDVSTASGTIECGDVRGSLSTTSGDVDCRNIGGNITTVSGDVNQRRA
jgi:hypothetical protein